MRLISIPTVEEAMNNSGAASPHISSNELNAEQRRTMNRAIAPSRSNYAGNVRAPATPVKAANPEAGIIPNFGNVMSKLSLIQANNPVAQANGNAVVSVNGSVIPNSAPSSALPTFSIFKPWTWLSKKQSGGNNLLQNYVVTTNGGGRRLRKNKNTRLHQKQMARSRRSRRSSRRSRRASRRGGRRNNNVVNAVGVANNNGNWAEAVNVAKVSRRNKRRGGSRRGSRKSRRAARKSRRASRRASRNLRRAARLLKNAVKMSRKARSLRRRAGKAKKSRRSRKSRRNSRKSRKASRKNRKNSRKSRRSRKNRRNNRKNNNMVGNWF